jgi:hypothetical protein
VSQRRTVFADILSSKPKESDIERTETPAAQAKKAKLNKAVNPDYTKLTAYIPRNLYFEIKTAMAADQETDQSAYIERWLRKMLEQRQSGTESQRARVTA